MENSLVVLLRYQSLPRVVGPYTHCKDRQLWVEIEFYMNTALPCLHTACSSLKHKNCNL